MSSELIVLEKPSIEKLFLEEGGLVPLLNQIKSKALETVIEGDIKEESYRKEVKRHAKRVVSSKTFLDNVGKELTEEWRANTAKVNGQRNQIKDILDGVRDEILAPVKEFEDARKKIEAELLERISKIEKVRTTLNIKSEKSLLEANLAGLVNVNLDDADWGDLEAKAYKEKDLSIKFVQELLADKDRYDEEQKELEELRASKAEKEALEKLKIEEDEKRDRETRELKQKIEMMEREKFDAVEREKRLQEEKIKAEQDAIKAKEEAEKKAKEEERARIEKEALEKAEREKSIEQERENKRIVHGSILSAFIANGLTEDQGKEIITLIVTGRVPNLKISYNL